MKTLLERLLSRLLPAEGKHRPVQPVRPLDVTNRAMLLRLPEMAKYPLLRGDDVALVRPYLIAHERRMAVIA